MSSDTGPGQRPGQHPAWGDRRRGLPGASAGLLVVEDSPTQALKLRELLEAHGYQVAAAGNGLEALALLAESLPDIVLSDVIMPEMDGYELCRRIKADQRLAGLPVLLVTALNDPGDVVRALECGADDFIVKPYAEENLIARVQFNLANRQLHATDRAEIGVEVFFAGHRHFISSGRLQILNLLLSTYETAVRRNLDLERAREELEALNESLDEKVRERSAALAATEARYRRLFESAKDGILILDADTGVVVDVNPYLAELLDFPPDRIIGKYPWDLGPLRNILATKAALAELRDKGYVRYQDLPLATSDGREIPVELVSNSYLVDGRTVIQCNIRDISERKQAEEEIRRQNRRLCVLYAIDRAAAQSLDLDEILTDAVEATIEALGVDSAGIFLLEEDGETMRFAVHRGVSEEFARSVARIKLGEGVSGRAAAEGRPVVVDVPDYPSERLAPFVVREGFQTLASTPLFSGGQLVGALNLGARHRHAFPPEELELLTAVGRQLGGAVRNAQLFGKLKAELLERRRTEAELRASEERFRAVAQSANEAIIVADAHGRIVLWSSGAERLFLHTEEEALGQPVTILMPEPYLSRHREGVGRLLATGVPRVIGTTYEARGVRKDGNEVDVEVSLARWEGSGGMSYGAIIRDIGERKRLQEQLLQSQKMEAVGRLAGGVAHDFNNILQAMLSQIQSLRLQQDSRDKVAGVVAELEVQVKHGASLTRQLLLFSRRETARPERLDLNEVVSGTLKMLRRLVRENVSFTVELADEPLPVEGDRGQLNQVLTNLVVNASHAMPVGGTLSIRTARQGPGSVCLAVEDTGCGIPEEIRERIFEPFFTTKAAEHGTGLGLSVVLGIVTQHGGRIDVESTVGKGSTFRVVLPLAATQGSAANELATAEGDALTGGAGERVLVVEDEEGAREGLQSILGSLCYEVVAVGSGGEAGRLPAQPAFDVLLTDLMLPDMLGTELARGLVDRWPGLKVILMSGYTEDEAVRRGAGDGTVRFLQKPFNMAALAREVRTALAAEVGSTGPR